MTTGYLKANNGLVDNNENIEDGAIEEYRQETQDLKQEIQKFYEDIFSNLDFWYKVSETKKSSRNINDQLDEKFKDSSNSKEKALFSNPQVQILLDNIVSVQWNSIKKEKQQLNWYISKRSLVNPQNDTEEEIWDNDRISMEFEDFKLTHLSIEEFENFISSEEWIRIIIDEIQKHINPKTGEMYTDYPISAEILRLKLKTEWDSIMFREYHTIFPGIGTDNYINEMHSVVGDNINTLIGDHIKRWWRDFNVELINNLELLISQIEQLFSNNWNEEWIDIDGDIVELRKYLFCDFLETLINEFSDIVYKDGDISLDTWEIQMDLQLRSYLFIYWKIFFPNLFKDTQINSWYDANMLDLLKIILCKYNPEIETKIRNKKLLEEKKKAEQERRERELRIRQEAERRNRERNNNSKRLWDFGNKWWNQDSDDSKDNNWVQLVKKSNLKLSDFSVWWEDSESFSENMHTKHIAFRLAWDDFINSHDGIKNIVTYPDMQKLYNIETGSIDKTAWKSFLETDIMKWRTDEEIDKILQTLNTFSGNFDNAMKNITSTMEQRKWKMDDEIKMHALWSVVDNVKAIFDNIVKKWQWDSKFEWFLFDAHNPVTRKWNDIIISWKFNWADIKIRYNLFSGEIFMNSFLQHLSPSKIKIWNNTDADYKIGQLESFDTILDEHYRIPSISNEASSWYNSHHNFNHQSNWWKWNQNTIQQEADQQESTWDMESSSNLNNSFTVQSATTIISHSGTMWKDEIDSLRKTFWEMIHANLELIGNTIINHTKKQSARNSIITKFMKTFNIISDEQFENTIDVNDWSNMFDFLQIIENSDSTSLETFQVFMGKIMEYSWLRRWNNNLQWSQRNQKSDLILDENNGNKYASLLRNCSKDFSNNLEDLKWKLNFDSNSKLWFIDMISKNITNDVTKPNRKLDISKMNEFIYHLENDTKTVV